jgi:hypothetical protein
MFYNLENVVWLSEVNLHIITVDEVRNIEICSYSNELLINFLSLSIAGQIDWHASVFQNRPAFMLNQISGP